MKVLTRFQEVLLKEYNRTRKQLRTRLKRSMAPADVKVFINESFTELTERQAKIIIQYTYKTFKKGISDADEEISSVRIAAAAAAPNIPGGTFKFDLDTVSTKQMNRIMHHNLGAIGKYNDNLSKAHQAQYNLLLSDSKLLRSLNTYGWTPWLEEEWKKRGIAPEIIKLIKGQKTSAQMISILNWKGIVGGGHPNEVAKKLVPHINRFFGSDGVVIDNVGKTTNRLLVDADGNFEWVKKKIKNVYRASPRTYSRMLARNVLREARMDAYYDSLAKSKFLDYFISIAHMDSTTCGLCATMHGRRVTKGSGPLYHGNCGCDLRPVWKKNSPLASQNKQDAFYEKQRNMHFLRMADLKRYNAKMPRGMKLKYATQLPQDAITKVMPGKIKMRAIRHEMLGKPKAIPHVLEKAKTVSDVSIHEVTSKTPWGLSDAEWKTEADTLYKKTAKDGCEHLKLFNGKITHFRGDESSVKFTIPRDKFFSLHTHPNWNAPLSPTDLMSSLENLNEIVGGATSKSHIYLMKRTPETKSFNKLKDSEELNSVYMKARTAAKRKIARTGLYKGWETDVSQAGNKAVAKEWNFVLKIIKR